MRGSGLVGAASALVLFTAVTTPAHAQSSATPAVWYRASAECPAGPEFLSKIADGRTRARLAQAGDHIDFVVTLLAANGETVGRLERQTNGGTVAIRELRDATCAHVADALALSLGLALDPARTGADPEVAPVAPKPTASNEAALAPVPPAPVSVAPTAVASKPSKPSKPSEPDAQPTPTPRRAEFVGVDAGAFTGLSTAPMLRGSVFVDSAPTLKRLFSLRFALVGALGSSPTPFGSVERWVLAGRGELCPWRWGSARVGLQPFAAFELGATTASVSGQTAPSAHSLWAAPGVGLRASLALLPQLRLEVGAGILVPLVRAQIFASDHSLYHDEIIAFHAAAGVSFGQP